MKLKKEIKTSFILLSEVWNLRLAEVAGQNFERITKLKQLIKTKLLDWTNPKDLAKKADYYKGFKQLHSEIGYSPLRVLATIMTSVLS